MIGTLVQPRSPSMTSTPSRSGSPRSSTTRSGRAAAASDSALRPVAAVTTSCPRACRVIRIARSSCGSSSTTRTWLTAAPWPAPVGPAARAPSSARRPGCAPARACRPSPRPGRGTAPARGRRRWCCPGRRAAGTDEDQLPVGLRHTRTEVDHPYLHPVPMRAALDLRRAARRRVSNRVRPEFDQDALQQAGKPTTTSVPRSSRRCASPTIAYVLPTPGAAPR